MKVRFDIPDTLLGNAKEIAHVPGDDPEAAWSYPLTSAQTRRLAKLIGAKADSDTAEFFLEAFAHPSATARST